MADLLDLLVAMPISPASELDRLPGGYVGSGSYRILEKSPGTVVLGALVREKRIHDACCFDSSPLSTFRVLREKVQSTLRGPWWHGYENETVNALIKQAQTTFPDG
jgi:hypothetical protein